LYFNWQSILILKKNKKNWAQSIHRGIIPAMLFWPANTPCLKDWKFPLYDRYSLAQLLCTAGFVNPTVQTATQSWIPEWDSFNLDTPPDGTVNKPDSLFMEALKPKEM